MPCMLIVLAFNDLQESSLVYSDWQEEVELVGTYTPNFSRSDDDNIVLRAYSFHFVLQSFCYFVTRFFGDCNLIISIENWYKRLP